MPGPGAVQAYSGNCSSSWAGRGQVRWAVTQASRRGGERRPCAQQRRDRVVKVKLSAAEKAALSAAADRAGMALAAWIGQASLAVAEHQALPLAQREMLAELNRAAGLVRRAGVNLNQAVARLNATGEPGPDLGPAVAYCMRAVRRVDEAALLIRRGLR